MQRRAAAFSKVVSRYGCCDEPRLWTATARMFSCSATGLASSATPKPTSVRIGPPPPKRVKPWSVNSQRAFLAAAIGAGGISGLIMYTHVTESKADAFPAAPSAAKQRVIRRAEVAQHTSQEAGIWVTRGEGVYDITEFVSAHPGGASKIMLAAGGDISKFWAMYAQHKQEQVLDILESMRIGTLPEEDRVADTLAASPYANDPERRPEMLERSATPYNAEAPPDALEPFVTPTELHFKRHHLPVPDVLEQAYQLQVMPPGASEAHTFTVDELKARFPSHSVAVTLQCAGNRRAEMSAERETRGLAWTGGAISTAVWTGVKLSDVLKAFDVVPGAEARHVEFVGLDCDTEGQRYAASIPIEKAVSPDGDVLLAYEMNGGPIPRDHGYPLRAVVPGHVAARNVKWVEKIIVSADESDSHWQQEDYKGFCPDEDWNNLDWSKSPSIQEMPITSAILRTSAEGTVPEGAKTLPLTGYALAGGGRAVVRVDVSVNGGKSWAPATLKAFPEGHEPGYHRAWAWRQWQIEVPLEKPAGKGEKYEVICKAVDDSYNVQPDTWGPIYNARGVLANSWHRIHLSVN